MAVIALVGVFLLSTLVSWKMKYKDSYWLFEAFHLFAGFFIAMFFSGLLDSDVFIVLTTLAIGIIWEILEFIRSHSRKLDAFLLKFKIKQGKITLADTLLDLFLDLAGAILFLFVYSLQ